jgi:hypothetical protein
LIGFEVLLGNRVLENFPELGVDEYLLGSLRLIILVSLHQALFDLLFNSSLIECIKDLGYGYEIH